MSYEIICTQDEVWEGDMDCFDSNDGQSILVMCLNGGEFKAFQGICPHQETELVQGTLENGILTCSAHLWQFDCKTGKGINPDDCRIAEYPIKVEGDNLLVDTVGITPYKSHT